MPQGRMTVTDDEIVEEMRRRDDPAFITKEIASWFDMGTEGMRNRLKSLADQGRIRAKKPSSRTQIWWTEAAHDSVAFSP
jgi:predicted transcriptional regulator